MKNALDDASPQWRRPGNQLKTYKGMTDEKPPSRLLSQSAEYKTFVRELGGSPGE
jgi:hypothetical protein